MEKSNEKKAVKAACKYIERKGMEVIRPNGYECEHGAVDIVAIDDGDIVLIEVSHRAMGEGAMPKPRISRDAFEMIAASFLAQGNCPEHVDCAVRLDAISLLILSDDRAMLRHEVNASGSRDWE